MAKYDKDGSQLSESELTLYDLSELNEPLDTLMDMYKTLESGTASLSIDTRMCQFVFDKLRKCDRFALLAFSNDSLKNVNKNGQDSKSIYTRKLHEFCKVVKRVMSNSREIFKNFHSRLLGKHKDNYVFV